MQICSPSKGKVYSIKDILEEFGKFYSSYYSVQGKYRDLSTAALKAKVDVYLEENKLPSIPLDQKAEPEYDFTHEELQSAVKALKKWQKLWPRWLYL